MRNDDDYYYSRGSSGTGWFVAIIVTLALVAIGYLVFSVNDCSGAACSISVEAPK